MYRGNNQNQGYARPTDNNASQSVMVIIINAVARRFRENRASLFFQQVNQLIRYIVSLSIDLLIIRSTYFLKLFPFISINHLRVTLHTSLHRYSSVIEAEGWARNKWWCGMMIIIIIGSAPHVPNEDR